MRLTLRAPYRNVRQLPPAARALALEEPRDEQLHQGADVVGVVAWFGVAFHNRMVRGVWSSLPTMIIDGDQARSTNSAAA